MLADRWLVARQYLDDAHHLLTAGRLESAISRAYYATYQAMWAILEAPPAGDNGVSWASSAILHEATGIHQRSLPLGQGC